MTRLSIAPGVTDANFTSQLHRMKKLTAKNRGDLGTALPSAAHYAQKTGHTMYVYIGNSFGHIVYRVSDKPSEYLNPINNTGTEIFSVAPDLTVSRHQLSRDTAQRIEENMATRKRSAPKGKGRGGSSGGGNPRTGGREISEQQHEDAMRVLRAEYYQGVRGIAQEVANLVKNEGMDEGDALHQTVDGSYWVIYTHANFQVLMCSDHHDAYSEEFGEAPVSGADINWAALAYAALARDVSEQVGSGDLDEAPRGRSVRASLRGGPRGLRRR